MNLCSYIAITCVNYVNAESMATGSWKAFLLLRLSQWLLVLLITSCSSSCNDTVVAVVKSV